MVFLSPKNWKLPIIWISILGLFLASQTTFAAISVYESFVATNASKTELIGETSGEQFGAVVVSGDFNHDKIQDIAVGSPFFSMGDSEWNGKVTIIFGKKNFNMKNYDLAKSEPDVVFYGAHSGDQFGNAITVGDFNNDKIDDIAMGAYNAYNEGSRSGKVYIVFGQSTWSRQSYNFLSDKPNIELRGISSDEGFGLSLSTIDINSDNVDDVLVGSPFSSSEVIKKSGLVYTYFGKSTSASTAVYTSNDANVTFYGQTENERFGSSISGGHILSVDTNDIVIGAYTSDVGSMRQAGKIYFYKGVRKFPSKIRSSTSVIKGIHEKEWFGFSVSVGDVNGDRKDDIAISSFPYNGNRDAAKVAVFYSKKTFGEEGTVFVADSDTSDVIIENPRGQSLIGASVLLSDINSDKKAEIIVGAPGVGDPTSSDSGDVYIIFNGNTSKKLIYSADYESVTSTVHGENADDWFGYSIAVVDFNRDGYKDLAVGSRYSDAGKSSNNGKVFVLYGSSQPYGKMKTVLSPDDHFVKRAELIHQVIERLDLKNTKADIIKDCYAYKNFCLFNFVAMSLYNEIQLDPKPILYPDIQTDSKYYEDVVIGTMLGLINGNNTEKDSPFYPDKPMSRIQTLKIILGAADLVKPMYRFELVRELGSFDKLLKQPSYFEDIDSKISSMWWYPRYTNFAVEHGIVKKMRFFRPDDKITVGELVSMLNNTMAYLKFRPKS